MTPASAVAAVRGALSPDLLQPRFRAARRGPLFGHCYVASEALLHMLRAAGDDRWCPCRAKDAAGVVHWWLERRDGDDRLDPTGTQYDPDTLADLHSRGRRAGFLTADPSRRARIVIDRVLARGVHEI